ncbi:MAG TPA: hypothetical protein VGR56_00150 [Nitrososphaerales archaeon]|nr:hypothetical protein [Nitrososphaerales archaeon]
MLAISYAYAAEAGSAGAIAEIVSLFLILASTALVVYLNYRIRNIRTFQFEMLLFTIILVAAEIPRTLYSLGVIDLDFLSATGLEIHSVSMVILALFVAYRTVGFFRGRQITAMAGSYEEVLLSSIRGALVDGLGDTSAKALDFYLDSKILISDPVEYEKSMTKFLGPGAKPVIEHLLDKVCSSAGIERSSVHSLEQCLAEARRKLN